MLLLFVTGCGAFAQVPPDRAVQLAIARQLTHTQHTLARDLGIAVETDLAFKPNFKIDNFTVSSRQKIPSADARYPGDVYRVRGTFKATLAAPNRQLKAASVQQTSPFDIYLSTNPKDDSDVETWFLIESEALAG